MTSDREGQGQMTCLGRFAGELPLDMRLSMLIHYGFALGASVHSTSLSQSAPVLLSSFLTFNFPACPPNIHFSSTVLLTSHLLQFSPHPISIQSKNSPYSLFFLIKRFRCGERCVRCCTVPTAIRIQKD